MEHENLRASLDWSFAEPGARGGLRLCGALQRFWWTRGHLSEGREWCARILGKAGAEERTLGRAKALNGAGLLAYWQGDYPVARVLHEESLAIRQALGDRRGDASSRHNLAMVAKSEGDYASAKALYEESLAIKRELGDRWGMAATLNNLGSVVYEQGDYPVSKSLHEESLAIVRALGDRMGVAASLSNLGEMACDQGDYRAASALHREGLAIRRDVGDKRGIAYSLEGLAAVVTGCGDSLRAAGLWGAAARLRNEIRSPMAPNDRPGYDRRVAAARAAARDDVAFDRAWKEGGALTLDQAIDLALQETREQE
jgi:tetratricopeptide (TPR) repeat protein